MQGLSANAISAVESNSSAAIKLFKNLDALQASEKWFSPLETLLAVSRVSMKKFLTFINIMT
ncbi:MAG: hypothetical protein B0W54_15890 [Cellvibrio sp. 79]|nr:MAG: hypothetical protein B0W54_15890 [Cellvibrio sp. 79]